MAYLWVGKSTYIEWVYQWSRELLGIVRGEMEWTQVEVRWYILEKLSTLRFMSLIMSQGKWWQLHHFKYLKQDLKRSIKHTVHFYRKRKCMRFFPHINCGIMWISRCICIRYWKISTFEPYQNLDSNKRPLM